MSGDTDKSVEFLQIIQDVIHRSDFDAQVKGQLMNKFVDMHTGGQLVNFVYRNFVITPHDSTQQELDSLEQKLLAYHTAMQLLVDNLGKSNDGGIDIATKVKQLDNKVIKGELTIDQVLEGLRLLLVSNN